MGAIYSCLTCQDEIQEADVMMIGLDCAGKTTILNFLKNQKTAETSTLPTIGFNAEKIKIKGLSMTVWDIGGQQNLRTLWKHYYAYVQAIIFVLDGSDIDRICMHTENNSSSVDIVDDDTAEYWIKHLSSLRGLENCSFLILANKQDVKHSMSINCIIDKLDLCGVLRGKKWHVQPTVALTGEGINSAFEWLSAILQNKCV